MLLPTTVWVPVAFTRTVSPSAIPSTVTSRLVSAVPSYILLAEEVVIFSSRGSTVTAVPEKPSDKLSRPPEEKTGFAERA